MSDKKQGSTIGFNADGVIINSIEEKKIPNAFVTGIGYYAGSLDISADKLVDIPVGVQEHSIAEGSITVQADRPPLTPLSETIPIPFVGMIEVDSTNIESEAVTVAKRMHKQSPITVAWDAQRKNVSRRLVLAERSKKVTVNCPISGITSLIEIPQIPFPASNKHLQQSLIWSSPFGSIDNCRGLAQQGMSYLRKLDTQTLSGILVVLASTYELFRFQPMDSAAQKNALLRTAGKDYLIDAIIMIEELVHSANYRFLPKLSLVMDVELASTGLQSRMQQYLKLLAEAIAKPDKEAYDEKRTLPLHPIRPVYIKDVENAKKTVSFLARKEQAAAKKEFIEDKKAGKIAFSQLMSQVPSMTDKLKQLITGLLSDDGMLLFPPLIIDAVVTKLKTFNNGNANQLVTIFEKSRKALKLNLSELADDIEESLVADEEEDSIQQDDATPGNEEAIEEPTIADELAYVPHDEQAELNMYVKNDKEEEIKLVVPEGLSAWEQLLWKKKMLAATSKPRNIIQNDLPSSTTYTPSAKKVNLGDKE